MLSNHFHENLLTIFLNEYINYINSNIYKMIEYYTKNNNELNLHELNCILNKIRKNLFDFFNQITDKNKVKKINRLGDMHGKNKCTLLIEYYNKKIIFKPFHAHFLNLTNQILNIFNLSKKFNFYHLNLISQNNNYSYIEHISNELPDDINKFSYHYGAIIFILTLLRGTDFHSENIFCKSSTPVIIDYETFFYPQITGFKDHDIEATSLIKTKNNTHTLMNYYDINIPLLIEGVNSAYSIVKKNETYIFSLIKRYHKLLTRIIFKPTSYYINVLKNSTHPSLLSSRKLRRKYLEDCLIGENNILSFIIKHEIEDLLTLNIPAFYFENGYLYTSTRKKINQEKIFSCFELIHNDLINLKFFRKKIITIIGAT